MVLEIVYSLIVALVGTVFSVIASVQGVESKNILIGISLISFVFFFIVSFYFNLPTIVLSLI